MMRTVRLVAVLLVLVAFVCFRPQAGKSDAGEPLLYVDAAKYTAYRQAEKAFGYSDEKRDLAGALAALTRLQATDGDNALDHYLLAAVHAKKGDWEAVARELTAGNRARNCVEYQQADNPMRLFPSLPRLRGLARDGAAAASQLPVDQGGSLLRSVRVMATRLAAVKPVDPVSPLVADSIRRIADKALVELYEKAGRAEDAEEARSMQTADDAWGKQVKADLRALPGMPDLVDHLSRKHGFTPEEQWITADQQPSEERKRKMAAFNNEWDTVVRPLVERFAKAMPE